MKIGIWKTVLAVFVCTVSLFGTALSAYADGSHGFYMDCDAGVVNDKADGFMIDFYSDSDQALCTYWSNANWGMYTDMTAKMLGCRELTGGGAYAGLQLRGNLSDRTGIMSLWRYEYTDKDTGEINYIYANAVYGKTTTYDNEGSGTSCVMPFDWQNHRWYRQLLLCWQDMETGYTFIGTWFYDYEADKWSLFAYYNTQLIYSYIKGDVGQFLENYAEREGARYRSFRYRNIYFLSHDSGEWVSSPTVSIRSDGNEKAFGEAKLGISEDNTYVWATVDGTSAIDTDHTLSLNPTLVQEETPDVGIPQIADFSVKCYQTNGRITGGRISWEMADNSTPQLSYVLTVTDQNGKQLRRYAQTRPEVASMALDSLETDAFKCELTVTDVFGNSTTATYCSEKYNEKPKQTVEPDSGTEKDNDTPGWILPLGIGIGAATVIAIAVTTAVVLRKKKHQ